MLTIYVDGDACPVKDEVLRVATRYGLHIYMVSNNGARPVPGGFYHVITVGAGFDAADDWIAEHITPGDIAITADIQLAARCLTKQAAALSPTGRLFTTANIGNALASRSLSAHLRETGESKGHNPTFSKNDRSRFLQELDKLVQQNKSL